MVRLPSRRTTRRAAYQFPSAAFAWDRAHAKAQLGERRFDAVIVGGGVTGAYSALDLAARGLSVALVERDDFASGTSSKSSKMVHGGLRYIEQGNLPLVRRSLAERQRFRRNAPHLVQRLPFLFPLQDKEGLFSPTMAAGFEAALWTYDLAGGWRMGKLHDRLSVPEVMARAPKLRAETLTGGLVYYDTRADDARLTLAIVRTAAQNGAVVLNGAKATGLLFAGGTARGVRVEADGDTIDVEAGVVVNATGVWTDEVTALDRPRPRPRMRPAKGVHIVVPWVKLGIEGCVTVPIPGRAKRATCTRWGDTVIVGTTDDDYDGDLDDVYCTRTEMDYLLEGATRAFDVDLGPGDVLGSIAGLRPLVGQTTGKTIDAVRDAAISRSRSGLVTITGGKLTTARYMGQMVGDHVARALGSKASSRTARMPLTGGAGFDVEATMAATGSATHLSGRYGTEARFVREIYEADPALGEVLVDGLPYLKAEVVFAARHEMARSVDDVLSRRTRARLFGRDASLKAADEVGRLLGAELDLSETTIADQVRAYRDSIDHEKHVLLGGTP